MSDDDDLVAKVLDVLKAKGVCDMIVAARRAAADALPKGRESSLVLTKLDEAAFWAQAAHKAASGMDIHER